MEPNRDKAMADRQPTLTERVDTLYDMVGRLTEQLQIHKGQSRVLRTRLESVVGPITFEDETLKSEEPTTRESREWRERR